MLPYCHAGTHRRSRRDCHVRVDERNTMMAGVSPETSPSASYLRSTSVLYFCFADKRAPLTAGPICQCVFFDFSYLFHRFEYIFQKFISGDRVIQFE